MAIMSERESLGFETQIRSDTAALHTLVEAAFTAVPQAACAARPHPWRPGHDAQRDRQPVGRGHDARRGRAARGLRRWRQPANFSAWIRLYVANEGKLVALCAAEDATCLAAARLRAHPLGAQAAAHRPGDRGSAPLRADDHLRSEAAGWSTGSAANNCRASADASQRHGRSAYHRPHEIRALRCAGGRRRTPVGRSHTPHPGRPLRGLRRLLRRGSTRAVLEAQPEGSDRRDPLRPAHAGFERHRVPQAGARALPRSGAGDHLRPHRRRGHHPGHQRRRHLPVRAQALDAGRNWWNWSSGAVDAKRLQHDVRRIDLELRSGGTVLQPARGRASRLRCSCTTSSPASCARLAAPWSRCVHWRNA